MCVYIVLFMFYIYIFYFHVYLYIYMCVSICLFLFLFRFVYMYTHLEPKHVFGGYTAKDGGCLLFERTIAKAVEYPNSLFQKTHQF